MNSALGRVLVIIGVVLVVAGVLVHFVVKVNIVPHFSIILGVVGVIVAAVGLYAMLGNNPNG